MRQAVRTLSTVPPPPPVQPAPNPMPKKGAYHTFLYGVLGVAAAGSAYYYFMQDEEKSGELKVKAKGDEERLKNKTRDAIDVAKTRSGEMERRVKEDYQQLKDKAAGLKSTVEKDLSGAEARGKSIGEDLGSKLESAKEAARGGLDRARESTENLYQEARSSAEHKAHEAREAAEKKSAEAKQGWFSWLGWGRSKVDEGKEKVASESDRLQREAGKR